MLRSKCYGLVWMNSWLLGKMQPLFVIDFFMLQLRVKPELKGRRMLAAALKNLKIVTLMVGRASAIQEAVVQIER